MTNDRYEHRFALLGLLLAADFAFLVLYALYGFKVLTDPKLGLIEDWSYGEVFQYIKEFWIVLLLATLFVRHRSWVLLNWCLLFVYLLLDDSLRIHERGGEVVADTFGFVPWLGLRAVDFGEMVVSAVAALLLLSVAVTTYRCRQQAVRRFSQRLGVLLLALIFFGVGVDMVPIKEPWLLNKAVGAFEDGGEQVCMSLIFAFVFAQTTGGLGAAGQRLLRRESFARDDLAETFDTVREPELSAV